jgi:hypothetical protein
MPRSARSLNEAGFSAQDLVAALKSIDAHRLRLESDGEIAKAIAHAIQRIDLRRDGFELTLDLKPLVADRLMVPDGARLTIKRLVPLQLRRRGVELRLVMQGEAAAHMSKIDPLLLKAIVRGRRWFAELASNCATDTREIAKREGLHDSYVRRLIPLAFLAPSIVEAICEGRQPPDLTAERLSRARMPYEWAEQYARSRRPPKLGLPSESSALAPRMIYSSGAVNLFAVTPTHRGRERNRQSPCISVSNTRSPVSRDS